MNEVLSFA